DAVGIYLPQADGSFRGYVGKPDNINGITLDQMVVDPKTDLLAKEIIETRKSVYIPDTSNDNRPDPRPIQLFRIRSLLGLPICYEEEIFGLVFLFVYDVPMHLNHEEIQTIEAYVNMAAVAIRNANLFSQKEKLILKKQILLDATKQLSLCLTTREVVDTCFHYVGRALNNTNIAIHLMDTHGKKMYPAKLSNDSEWKDEDWKRVHQKTKLDSETDMVFSEAVRNKKTIVIPDVDLDHRPNSLVCDSFGIKGLVVIPLVAMGEVLGTICVVSLGVARNYPERELNLTQSIVEATAAALANIIRGEELLRRADRLHIVGELAASISHEVRNPLSVVRGCVQLLKEKPALSKQDYYEMIVAELDRANDMISDFLSLAQNRLVERGECNLNQIIKEISPILMADATMKGQSLEIKLNENLPNVLLNEKEIKQVILNLVRNGIESMGPNGKVTITTNEINGMIELRISDTGCGMSNDQINKLFKPFYTTKAKGTGLGLVVCKNIVSNHGGKLYVESEEGKGTTFIVTLMTV
ncbi:MAG TPA: ATP-binding protein, partial [Desulfobacteria bacterium]|nr:ATP-binding protein [Desulfobacteria bacterium]